MKMPGKCKGPGWLEKDFKNKRKVWGQEHLEEHAMVGRTDPHGEALAWCRKCSGFARCRLGPKLMNRCKPEEKGTKEHRKMLKIILKLEKGEVPDKSGKEWKVDGERRIVTRKECKPLREEFDVGGFMVQNRVVQHSQTETEEHWLN